MTTELTDAQRQQLSDHFDYYEEDDEADYEEDDDEDEWECAFGVRCLMQSVPHLRSQCYTREMAEAWADEAAQNS